MIETSSISDMGLKFLGSVLRPFLYKGLISANLHLSGKEASLMERLQILAIGLQSVFEQRKNYKDQTKPIITFSGLFLN